MENLKEMIEYISLSVIIIGIVCMVILPFAFASSIESDIYDQWNTIQEFEKVSSLRHFLIEKEWIDESVSIEELDYILVLAQQCSSEFFPSVPTSLALSIMSVESGFNKDLEGFSEDIGLMQIIAKYHQDRIHKYIYDENVDLYDPRLNIMVGIDFLEELLNWAEGDITKAIMAYNMGQRKASNMLSSGYTSTYARTVLERMEEIELFLERR